MGGGDSGGNDGKDGKDGKGDKPPLTTESVKAEGEPEANSDKPAEVKAEDDARSANDATDGAGEVGELVPVTNNKLSRDFSDPASPMVALPLGRRPLFPGQQQLLQITHPDVVKKVTELLTQKSPIVSVFLRKDFEESSEPQGGEARISLGGRKRRGKQEIVGDFSGVPEDLNGADPFEVLYKVGTRARIAQAAQFGAQSHEGSGSEGLTLLLFGHDLVELEHVLDAGPPTTVKVSRLKPKKAPAEDVNPDELKAYINETMHTIREIMKVNPQFREHMAVIHKGVERLEKGDPHAIAHFGASLTTASGVSLMEVIEEQQPLVKLQKSLVLLKKELELSQLQQKIASQIEEKVSGQQREFLLREQLKMLKKELGEEKDQAVTLGQKFVSQLEGKTVPKDAQAVIDVELDKFSSLSKDSQEFQVTRNYLDWLTLLPWGTYSTETLHLAKAKTVLDRDHYGLTDVKERILELIAVGQLRGTVQGKILCFVGPPGVGKTSIGRSIAEAVGREFHRFSVGGLYDVAEIKGHRRTYVGAMPGKVIQCLKKTQTQNPLILIDEIDKLGKGHQGDPASALLELLDPSQNSGFLDHYLDVPVDCSKILFVCTANTTDTIPGPLLDRMEVIRLSGYDQREKLAIAESYLVPSAMRDVGLWEPLPEEKPASKEKATAASTTTTTTIWPLPSPDAAGNATEVATKDAGHDIRKQLDLPPATPLPIKEDVETSDPKPAYTPDANIDKSALEGLIRWYCRESGVRNLQKHIEKIGRKLAMKVVERREVDGSESTPDAEQTDSSSSASSNPSDVAQKGEEDVAQVGEEEAMAALKVTETNLSDFVGKPLFTSDRLYEGATPCGTVMGLAWTSMGGTALYVEAMALPRTGDNKGTPSVSVTGQLGDVMKESSRIALLVARRQFSSGAVSVPEGRGSFFEEHELHLHCPEGATPKDGPSAGVTMVTSYLSLGLDRPVREDLAMTGEVSLNGKVLPVGGIKEKTIAARRAGCKLLCFPLANRRDFDELPDYLKEGLEVHYAAEYRDVAKVAFPDL